MTSPRVSPSLLYRLLVPTVGLVVAAVVANVVFAAWIAAGRSVRAAEVARTRVTRALATGRVPLTQPVIEAIGRLTGCELMVIETQGDVRRVAASTLPIATVAGDGYSSLIHGEVDGLQPRVGETVIVGPRRYRTGVVADVGSLGEHLVVLSPEEPLGRMTWETVWPTMAVALATLGVLVPLGYRTVRRLSCHFEAVERQVARIADGEFGSRVEHPSDGCAEIDRLADGVNRMSLSLARLQGSLVAGERQRLIGQLAAGFAHELRNAITGARLSIELHTRRCHAAAASDAGGRSDESLTVALRQLDILESEVRGLLTLARGGHTADAGPHEGADAPIPTRIDMASVVEEVAALVGPRCELAGVLLETTSRDRSRNEMAASCGNIWVAGRMGSLRSAILNLVINAMDAAGRGGVVRVEASIDGDRVLVEVDDTGPGPSESIRDSLAEPFVTTKPEGLGLGLAVARAVAIEHGGSLDWSRVMDHTRFTLVLPALVETDSTAAPEASAA